MFAIPMGDIRDASDSFSVCFNMVKVKYVDFDKTFDDTEFISPTDKVNVLINLEMVLKLLSTIKDLERKIIDTKDFVPIVVSNIINLAAHYRRFFRGNGLNTNVYLYYTDFNSTEFNECKYFEDFRMFYINKHQRNPKYIMLGEILTKEVIPQVKTMLDFIPGVYFVAAENLDAAAVPTIIHNIDATRKNVILTSDIIDTQYSDGYSYCTYLLKRTPDGLKVFYTKRGYLEYIIKNTSDLSYSQELEFYKNQAFYALLLSCLGEKYRSLDGVPGLRSSSLIKLLDRGIRDKVITSTTTELSVLLDVFPELSRDMIECNFKCISIDEIARRITKTQKDKVSMQLVDRSDNNSLMKLNSTIFFNHPILLEALTQ